MHLDAMRASFSVWRHMNPTVLEQCFRQLGTALGDAEISALVNLAARIDADGVVAVGPDGLELDTVLEPTLDHLEDGLDALQGAPLATIGEVVALLKALAAQTGENSLVPASYVPVATSGAAEGILLLGVEGRRAGRAFAFSGDGQNQAVTCHDDLEDLGPLGQLSIHPAQPATDAKRTLCVALGSDDLRALLAQPRISELSALTVDVHDSDKVPALGPEVLSAAPASLQRLVINVTQSRFALELRRGELGWSQLQCTIEPRQGGGPKAAFVRPLVQLLRSLPPLQTAGFLVADGLGRVLRNALAQVPSSSTWKVDVRGG